MSLKKFKLLTTHCSTVAESPTRSPVIHLRRRKTLRLLLTRSSSSDHRWRLPERHDSSEIICKADESSTESDRKRSDKKIRSRRNLRELFVSSPPLDEGGCGGGGDVDGVNTNGGIGEELTVRRLGFNGLVRPMSYSTLRCRLLRRAWRPILVTIPEQ